MAHLAREGNAREIVQLYRSLPPDMVNSRLATLVLQAIIKSKDITDKGDKAEKVWNLFEGMEKHLILYNCLMNAHSKSIDDPHRGEKAERWLRQVEKDGLQPDSYSYTSVINAYARTNLVEAQRLFDEYRERYEGNLDGGPFCALMTGWSVKSRETTEQLLQQIIDANLEIPVQAFMAVLRSQICGTATDGGENAHRWCLKYTQITNRKPDDRMWSLVLHAWSKSGRPDAGSQADLIMKDLLVSGPPMDTAVYNAWMDCWTKSGDPTAVHRVQEILEMLERNSFNSRFQPDVVSYSAAMQAWAKSGLPEAPRKAEELFARMQEPKGNKPGVVPILLCYEALMDVHARSPTGLARVLQILGDLERRAESGKMKLTVRTYAAALLALSQNPDVDTTKRAEALIDRMPNFGVTPNEHCYSLLITTYANDRWDKDGHRKAMLVMERIKQTGLTLNAHIYTAVITAFANHGDSTTAKSLWEEAQALTHSILPLNAALNSLRQVGTLEAAEEAESWFRSAVKTVEPDIATFSTLMSAWAQLGQVDRTMALLDEIKRDYSRCCGTYLYACAMEAYNNSDDAVEAATQVERLLQEMKDFGHRPNNVVLTTAIKAYIRNDDYRGKAAALLKEMEDAYSATGDRTMKPLPQAYRYFEQS